MASDMGAVRVAVRVRPMNRREIERNAKCIVSMVDKQTWLANPKINDDSDEAKKKFTFDYSYWSFNEADSHYASQEQVFSDLGREVVGATFEGYNSCVFAYGQTGSGKSYTMSGYGSAVGLIPRICEALFSRATDDGNSKYSAKVSYLEIYNEQVRDLLGHKSGVNLKCREHPSTGPYVEGLSVQEVTSFGEIEKLMELGNSARVVAATNMNDTSSRSHAVFTLLFTQASLVDGVPSEKVSKLNLVDLAGSERSSATGATGARLVEGSNINKSLTTLGLVISALAERSVVKKDKKAAHIPYRDSVLTFLLKESLGGNSKTIMVAAISPADINYGETLSTLHYANRAKNIVNKPVVNEDNNVRIIRELRAEIEQLKNLLGGDDNIARLKTEFEQAQKQLASAVTAEDKAAAQAAVDAANAALTKAETNGPSTELMQKIQAGEAMVNKLTSSWRSKWDDQKQIIEDRSLALSEHGRAVTVAPEQGPYLVLLSNDDPLATGIVMYYLHKGTTVLGATDSDPLPDIELTGAGVEAEHCMIEFDGQENVTLTPRNGSVMVQGTPVTEMVKLHQGQNLQFGDDNLFRFNHPAEAQRLKKLRESGGQIETPVRKSLARMINTPNTSPQSSTASLSLPPMQTPTTTTSTAPLATSATATTASTSTTSTPPSNAAAVVVDSSNPFFSADSNTPGAGARAPSRGSHPLSRDQSSQQLDLTSIDAASRADTASLSSSMPPSRAEPAGDYVEEEEIVDVGPATMIAEEVDDTSEEVASQLMQQAEKEKEILAMKIAELEEAMIEREEQLQSMHDQRLADAARKEEELEKERARQAEMEKQLHAEKERISARLVEEEAAMKKREAEQVAAREEAFRSKMAQLEEEHNRAILEYQTKMKSFESAMEEKAKFAADAETRAKEEEQRRARIEIETAEREALRIKEMEEHKLRLADIAAAAQEERLKREAVEMKSAELRAKNEKTQRDLQEQQRRAREDEKRRQEEDAARLASMEEVSRQLRARVQTAERRIEGKWTVTIPKYQLRQSSSGEYEAFEVNIRLDSSGWKVFRRYSEFESLHKLLKGMVPSVVPHIKLPGKGVFKSHDQRFLEKRRADLEVYLNDLVAKTLMLPESPFFARDRTSLMSKVPFFRPGDSLAE